MNGKLMVYMDDIVIAIYDIKEHFKLLGGVFERLVRNKF